MVVSDFTVVTGAVVTGFVSAVVTGFVTAVVTADVTAGVSGFSLTLLSNFILFSFANFSAYESFGQWITTDGLFEKVPLWIEVRLAGRVTSLRTLQYPNVL